MFRLGSRAESWAGTFALVSLIVLLATGCGVSRSQSDSSATSSARLSTAAGTKAAVTAWVGHMVSFVAEDPTTLSRAETGFALRADRGQLEYDRSQGAPENQYQPTGKVDWVAIPSQVPTLSEVARIETNEKPDSGSSVPAGSQDTLVLLERTSARAKWLISSWVNLYSPSASTLNQVRTIGSPLTSAVAARLPIAPATLSSAYLSYLGGGESSKFAPGQYTDQTRSQFASTRAGWAADGVSLTYPFGQSYVEGTYSLDGGDALVFFGFTYTDQFTANASTCIRQNTSNPNFPPSVPVGRYQSVTLTETSSAVAIEDPRSGTVSIVSDQLYSPFKATTTPATAPSCL